MAGTLYEQPILNSPYEEPGRHHVLDKDGQPTDQPPETGRRRSQLITPVPRPRKRGGKQASLELEAAEEEQAYNPTPIINEIRDAVRKWRKLPNPVDWGVTPTTQKLLQHWRSDDFEKEQRPFFCQLEAIETLIWLTEVADRRRRGKFWTHVKNANAEMNPDLLRLAIKMATGAGKTTVMAMLIAWQTLNAVRAGTGRSRFSRGFLVVTPGITIRDRLRVLLPSDPDNYYKHRKIIPPGMMEDIGKARVVVTNYHAFQRRERLKVGKVSKAMLEGRGGKPLQTLEAEGQMVRRVTQELQGLKNITVINDEAHHCYRARPDSTDVAALKGDEKKEAKEQNETGRVWINGIEAVARKLGVDVVHDLSATPFFLQGSGYREGTLFPWTMSDFSLMDAIECGIVKLPRVPVSDNILEAKMPVFRNLWEHIGKDMPKKGRTAGADLDPMELPMQLEMALRTLYAHYTQVCTDWEEARITTPPVFIVVCNNTATSKLVYEWISGWQRPNEDGERVTRHTGHLDRFSNFSEHGNRLAQANTILIDSRQLESGEALDGEFRNAAAAEIEQFKRERRERLGAGAGEKVSDADLLREVMNTVGQEGALGGRVRCVVSVAMLTEGWDARTVTHILGVRAFGTQLLCEQVVGRALRRRSYEMPDGKPLLAVEYAEIMGVPFAFAGPGNGPPPPPPKKTVRVMALEARARLEIRFPNVTGYHVEPPGDTLTAKFTPESRLELTSDLAGPTATQMEGIVGEGYELTAGDIRAGRPSQVAFNLTTHILLTHYRDEDGMPRVPLFNQLKPIVRRWIGECLELKGDTQLWMLQLPQVANLAGERIHGAIMAGAGEAAPITAILDPYNPAGSTARVDFRTSRDLWKTAADKNHINYVVCEGTWEAEFARVVEGHERVVCYVKNQNLGFEVPYSDGLRPRAYRPDFIVRVNDGGEEPLNLVIEVKGYKGYKGGNAALKAAAMRERWVPGVNNLGVWGRWAFAELEDVFEMDKDFQKVLEKAFDAMVARVSKGGGGA